MTTWAEAAQRGGATAVFWIEGRGLPWAFGDGVITEANKSTLFGDAFTPTQTFIKALVQPDEAFSRSIEIVPGRGSIGGFTFDLLDVATVSQPDGFVTWMMGADRTTIARTRLTADAAINVGSFNVAPDIGTDGVPQVFYCELETILGTPQHAANTINPATRAHFKSTPTAHRQDLRSLEYPEVTDHPTKWVGRVFTLFQSFLDGDGSLVTTDGTSAGARAAAKRWVGVLRDVQCRDGVWSFRCDSLDTMLKRQLLRGQPRVPVQPRVYVANAMMNQDVPANGLVAGILQIDPATDSQYSFRIQLATGYYSRSTFVDAFNAAVNPATLADQESGALSFKGTLALSFVGEEFRLTYTESAVGADVRVCLFVLAMPVYNVDANRPGNTAEYWEGIGASLEGGWAGNAGMYPVPEDNAAPAASDTYTVSMPGSQYTTIGCDLRVSNFRVSVGTDEEGNTAASFQAGDAVAIVSRAGVSACEVLTVDAGNGSMLLKPLPAVRQPSQIVHEGDADNPITVRRAFYGYGGMVAGLDAAALGQSTLQLLLSTGFTGYNHVNYDTLREGIGIAVPHESPSAGVDSTDSLIDVAAFERFFSEAEAYQFTVVDFVHEPTDALEWVAQRLAFLGGHLVVRNGQLSVVRVEALQSSNDATINEATLLPGHTITTGQLHTVGGVKYKHDWSMVTNEFMIVTDVVRGSSTAIEPVNEVVFEDRGIRVPDPLQLRLLGRDVLYQFTKENWVYDIECDRYQWDLEPGDVVRFSDDGTGDVANEARASQGMAHPNGTRGYGAGASATRMLVLAVTSELATGRTRARLVNVRTRRSGYSPAAWIESFTNVGNAVLTCTANFFRSSADGTDVAAFAVGDKVRIVSVNPTQAGAEPGVETSESGLTIQAIGPTPNTITLTGTLAVAWPSPPASASQCMVLVHDRYQTASQTDDAKAWAFGGASEVIGGTADPCYDW